MGAAIAMLSISPLLQVGLGAGGARLVLATSAEVNRTRDRLEASFADQRSFSAEDAYLSNWKQWEQTFRIAGGDPNGYIVVPATLTKRQPDQTDHDFCVVYILPPERPGLKGFARPATEIQTVGWKKIDGQDAGCKDPGVTAMGLEDAARHDPRLILFYTAKVGKTLVPQPLVLAWDEEKRTYGVDAGATAMLQGAKLPPATIAQARRILSSR